MLSISYQKSLVKRNVTIMWFANFFVAGSMTMVLPFISLYIESMGNFSDSYIQTWSGWVFAVTFITAFIFSPIWGRIGDKYGRKKILMMSATGLAISLMLMGFATSVWQLFLLRFIMGVFTGFIPMSQALIATQTKKEDAGKVLGTLQTGSVTGTLMGPLLGGVMADVFGYSAAFKTVAFTIFLSTLLVTFGIKEMKLKVTNKAEKTSYTPKEVIQHIVQSPILLIVMLTSALVQIAHFSIQPILSLYVAEINGVANIALFSGLAFSVTGLGNLLFARRWGVIGDKIGYIKVLIILLFAAGLVYFPIAFVVSLWQLLIFRFLLGIAIGGIDPVRMAFMRQEAPISMQGEVIGYNTSLRFLGNIIGPALGGVLAGFYGISSVFFVTSALLLITGSILLVTYVKHEKLDEALLHKS